MFSGNIALNKHATQPNTGGSNTADKAVDGGTDYLSCASPYMPIGQVTYWRVDLGFLHVIINVSVFYRNIFRGQNVYFLLYSVTPKPCKGVFFNIDHLMI